MFAVVEFSGEHVEGVAQAVDEDEHCGAVESWFDFFDADDGAFEAAHDSCGDVHLGGQFVGCGDDELLRELNFVLSLLLKRFKLFHVRRIDVHLAIFGMGVAQIAALAAD